MNAGSFQRLPRLHTELDSSTLVAQARYADGKIPLSNQRDGKVVSMPIEDLVNRSFLLPIEKDGTRR